VSRAESYRLFSELIAYPTADLLASAERCRALIAGRSPAAAGSLDGFISAIRGRSRSELEELYARGFDLNPTRCLDLGYQIFGETYKRGSFLVKMKEAARAHGVDPGTELPDHLPVVLRLLPLLGPEEDPVELGTEVVLPVIEKLLKSFEDDEGGYRSLFRALEQLMLGDYGIEVAPPLPFAAPRDGEGAPRKLPMFPGFNPPTERPWS